MGVVRVVAPVVTVLALGCGRLGFSGEAPMVGGGGSPAIDATALQAPAVGLVSYWSFDGVTDTSLLIDSAGGNSAACVAGSCPHGTAGVIGRAAQFDGATSCLDVPALAGWNDPTFTISAWVNSPSRSGPIVVHENSGGCPSPEMVLANGLGLVQLNTSNSTHNVAFTTSALPSPAAWHHVAASWDGTTQTIYVDGVCSCGIAPGLGALLNSAPFTIGCYPTGPAPTLFTGAIDEVRLYNRPLALDEISVLYELGGGTATVTACAQTCATASPP